MVVMLATMFSICCLGGCDSTDVQSEPASGSVQESTAQGSAAEAENFAAVEVTEGTYSIDVTLGGGSGKSTVLSPATPAGKLC